MAEKSYPFDSGEGATLNEDQWSYMASGWQDDGVDAPTPANTSLKVVTTGQPFTLLVKAGHAKVAGFHYHLDADKTVLFEENTSANLRVDRLVLRLNRDSNTVTLAVKKGPGTGTTVPPAVDRSWASPEVPLANFIVRANSDTVAPADLTDAREFVSSGVQMLSPANAASGSRQLSEGQIGYDPTARKFYAQASASKIEIGAQPDLSPYLTASSAQTTYVAKSALSGLVRAESAIRISNVTLASPWKAVNFQVSAWARGPMAMISGGVWWDQGGALAKGQSARIGTIADTWARPWQGFPITGIIYDSNDTYSGVAILQVLSNGELWFNSGSVPLRSTWQTVYFNGSYILDQY
ncbi:hypothetical protein [Nonomuraea roseola]|uniref:DNRLRE domain-containing protein n=1 Tax=Nonomuraea roseola TaxID=46179 RepID=A0ABV5Q0S2_9ACTN